MASSKRLTCWQRPLSEEEGWTYAGRASRRIGMKQSALSRLERGGFDRDEGRLSIQDSRRKVMEKAVCQGPRRTRGINR
jgi:hypothetical protein